MIKQDLTATTGKVSVELETRDKTFKRREKIYQSKMQETATVFLLQVKTNK